MSKKDKFMISCVALFLFSSILFISRSILAKNSTSEKYERKVILIDPGHGGMDGGAVSKNGTVEKNINLNISLKLKKQLESCGMKVIMTREEDKGLYSDNGTVRQKKVEDLKNRCNMKKESKCDMFISIHLNMFPQSQYYGAQVWYSNREDSKKLANIIQSNMKMDLDEKNKRVEKPAKNDYRIFRENNDMPSVLVECGFLSNATEEAKLKDSEYQEKVAKSISKSVKQYFKDK
ncbi:N-acetylmuramoyl-L-alanine amidase CwlD [Clostridium rectalis]|uniref:N-acetylmuramoyl-L-alanine amidase CwlD n=1 Tax=Clostridium rectalis TaxID=2040295 RepID=UPI000F62E450|nr:N-acetylmuramoyl-L-alanine amidase CwlD [Clostridium rectalis]